MAKTSICYAPYFSKHTAYNCHLQYTSVNWWYHLRFFFLFSKFRFFRLLVEYKGKKWPKMTKQYVLQWSIFQELYIIGLSFMVDKCKMIISPGVCFFFSSFFQSFYFWISKVKGQKMAQNDQKTLSIMPYISGTIHHTSFIYGGHVKKDNISKCYIKFFQILIFGVISRVKGFQEAYIIWPWFLVRICKMMTSLYPFFRFFKILIFWVVGGVKGQKIA